DIVRDAINIIGGSAALIIALLWYLGRRYSIGYFSALNIPYSQITLSLWEYGEFSVNSISSFLLGLFLICMVAVPLSHGATVPRMLYVVLDKRGKIIFLSVLVVASVASFILFSDVNVKNAIILLIMMAFIT